MNATTADAVTNSSVYGLAPQAYIALLCCAGLSAIGSLVIIVTYSLSKTLQSKIILRQVFFLSIATLAQSLSYFLSLGQYGSDLQPLPYRQFFCWAQGVVLQGCCLAGFVYNFYIAFDLVSFFDYVPQIKKHRLLYQLLVWPSVLMVSVILYLSKSFDETGGYCWVKDDPVYIRIIVFYVPLYLILGFCCFAIIAIAYTLRKMQLYQENRRVVITAAAYNTVFLICWLPASMFVASLASVVVFYFTLTMSLCRYRWFETRADKDHDQSTNDLPVGVQIMFAVCLTCQGLGNCLVWVSSRLYQVECRRLCSCKKAPVVHQYVL